MALNFKVLIGRLLARNERLDTAKLNSMFKSITVAPSGSVGTTDLEPGAVNAAATSADAFWYGVATTIGNAYTVAYTNAVTALIDGMWLSFRADAANVAGGRFDPGTGPMPLAKYGGLPLATGDIKAGEIVTVRWNATSLLVAGGCWEVMSLIGPKPIVEDFTPASARLGGVRGLVPSPKAGATRLFLRDDGWKDINGTIQQLLAAEAQTSLPLFLASQY